MREASVLYNEIYAEPGHKNRVRLTIDGVVYNHEDISFGGLNTLAELIPDMSKPIGNATARSLTVRLFPKSPIVRSAEIVLETQVISADETRQSEWIAGGTFYVTDRSEDNTKSRTDINITAYDAMIYADRPYIDFTAFDEWPQSEDDVVDEIADILGVEVDPRTALSGYMVDYPNDLTMREVLGYIAIANGGNWTITEENELRLVGLSPDMTLLGVDNNTILLFHDDAILVSGSVNRNRSATTTNEPLDVGRKVAKFLDHGTSPSYTGVKLWYDEENAYIAGNETGAVLEIDCPWATQAMATGIFGAIDGYSHQSFSALSVPAPATLEFGDIIAINNVNCVHTTISAEYGKVYRPNLSSPAANAEESDIEYQSQTERDIKRKVALGASYYGAGISRDKGFWCKTIDQLGNEHEALVINTDYFIVEDENGNRILDIDFARQTFRWNGDIIIQNGAITWDMLNGDTRATIQTIVDSGVTTLRSEVSNNYAAKDTVTSLSSRVDQTVNGIEASITRTQQDIGGLENSTTAKFNEISTYLRYYLDNNNRGVVELGDANNPIHLEARADRVAFVQNGIDVAYFSNNKLYVTEAEFLGGLRLGNYEWVVRSNGHLTLRMVN